MAFAFHYLLCFSHILKKNTYKSKENCIVLVMLFASVAFISCKIIIFALETNAKFGWNSYMSFLTGS